MFVSDEYGGDSQWVNQHDHNNKYQQKHGPYGSNAPIYMEGAWKEEGAPWPMNMTEPIKTFGAPHSIELRPTVNKKLGIRTIHDYTGSSSMFMV